MTVNPALGAFQRWCRARGIRQEQLAEDAMTSRAHLSQVLTGHRRGKHTWRRLVRVLPREGLLLLQQCSSWNADARAAWAEREARDDFVRRFGGDGM
jgi:transcriptional regulator with XRE-family HTH domain